MSDPRYSTARWKRLRVYVRQRDRNLCRLRLPGCKTIANTVDHIIEPGPPQLGQDHLFFSADNCQAACRSCNIRKRNQRTARLARQALGVDGPQAIPRSREW